MTPDSLPLLEEPYGLELQILLKRNPMNLVSILPFPSFFSVMVLLASMGSSVYAVCIFVFIKIEQFGPRKQTMPVDSDTEELGGGMNILECSSIFFFALIIFSIFFKYCKYSGGMNTLLHPTAEQELMDLESDNQRISLQECALPQ
jgi:hypothetical protein